MHTLEWVSTRKQAQRDEDCIAIVPLGLNGEVGHLGNRSNSHQEWGGPLITKEEHTGEPEGRMTWQMERDSTRSSPSSCTFRIGLAFAALVSL